MNNKPWWKSKGVWGGVVAALAAVAAVFGITVDEVTQKVILDAIVAVTAAIGAILAIVGRVKAKGGIGGR